MAVSAGGPRNYTGGDDDILAVYTKHLKQLTRKRGKDCKIFPDIGEASSPRLDRLKPFLDFLHELGRLEPHWRLGGPMQVRVLLRWNKIAGFRAIRESRSWARDELSKLWVMERAMDILASNASDWASFVGDTSKYPVPANRSGTAPQPEEDIFDGDDVDEDFEDSPKPEVAVRQMDVAAMPAWMLADLASMEVNDDPSDEDMESVATETQPDGAAKPPQQQQQQQDGEAKPPQQKQQQQDGEATPPQQKQQQPDGEGAAHQQLQHPDGEGTTHQQLQHPDGEGTTASTTAAAAATAVATAKTTLEEVFIENKLPCFIDGAKRKIFGEWSTDPSQDAMAVAIFPGSGPVELPNIAFADIPCRVMKRKRRRKANGKAKGKSKAAAKAAAGGAADGSTDGVGASKPKGKAKGKSKAAAKAAAVGDASAADGSADGVGAAEAKGKAKGKAQAAAKAAAGGDASADEAHDTVLVRPLQLWLKSRPAGQSVEDRHAEWRLKGSDFKKNYAMETKAERSGSS